MEKQAVLYHLNMRIGIDGEGQPEWLGKSAFKIARAPISRTKLALSWPADQRRSTKSS